MLGFGLDRRGRWNFQWVLSHEQGLVDMEAQMRQLMVGMEELQQQNRDMAARLEQAEARGGGGTPKSFDSKDEHWRDFSVVFKSYASLVNPDLEVGMEIPRTVGHLPPPHLI